MAGPRKQFTVGSEDGFHITVQTEFGEDYYVITIWPSNHGVTLTPLIRSFETAVALAKHLYGVLLPEFEAEKIRQKAEYKKFEAEMAARLKPKPPKIPKNAPILDVLICPECSELILPEDVSDERVYECGQCSTTGTGEDGRRCEQCNKFTAKVSDTSCPECGGAMDDAEEGHAQRATTDELVRYFTLDEIAAEEAAQAQEKASREAAEAERQQEQEARCERAIRLMLAIKTGDIPQATTANGITSLDFEGYKFEIREV